MKRRWSGPCRTGLLPAQLWMCIRDGAAAGGASPHPHGERGAGQPQRQ